MFNLTNSGLYDNQERVLVECLRHFTDKKDQIMTLAANAGTGKTYTGRNIIQCAAASGVRISAGAFTGRACTQLNESGIEANTLHSILLKPIVDDNGNLIRWEKKDNSAILDYIGDGILLDEASFIPLDMYIMFMDLGVQILNVGDYMQLPSISIGNDGENIEFNAMLDTTDKVVTLLKNRRFTEDSGIGLLATHLRRYNNIKYISAPDLTYVKKQTVMGEMYHRANQFDIVVCGYNNTRHSLNAVIRNARGYYDDIPEVGERVMCLKNTIINGSRLNNGELYDVDWVEKGHEYSKFILISECGKYRHSVDIMNTKWFNEDAPNPERKEPFGDFGFGYASTCHKVQGSTFPRVLIIDEDVSKFVDRQKWRYTGATRASTHLTIAS